MPYTRRRVVRLGGGVAALVTLLPARFAATQPATPTAAPATGVGETFVGRASDRDAFVAVVVGEAVGAGPRPVRAYLCADDTLALWFAGDLDGDRFTLLASGPPNDDATPVPSAAAAMTAELGPSGIRGSVELAGQALAFEAIPATGVAGLYAVARTADGTFDGASSTGAVLTGQQSAVTTEPLAATPTAGGEAAVAVDQPSYPIAGAILLAAGDDVPFTSIAHTAGADDFWWIVLADGSLRGAKRKRKRGGNNDKGKGKGKKKDKGQGNNGGAGGNGGGQDDAEPAPDPPPDPPPASIEDLRLDIEKAKTNKG